MGWTFTHRNKGQTTRQFFQNECFGSSWEIVTDGFGAYDYDGKPWYGLARKVETGEHVAFVFLTKTSSAYMNFGWKEMDESMGPNADDCPARVFAAIEKHIPVPPHDWAASWRERVRATLARKTQAKALVPEMVVEFAEPISFTNGDKLSRFVYMGGNCFVGVDTKIPYTIRQWKNNHFTVVEKEMAR